jgi:cyclophilin family peptidyl-prolyl cis-trans isomerase
MNIFLNFALLGLIAGATPTKAPLPKKLVGSDIIAASQPTDWRTPDQGNLLYMEIPQGRVIIELAPDYAPRHVERIKDLAKQKYWNGLAVVRVQDNYVVQWADPNAEKPELKRKFLGSEVVLPAELDVELKQATAFHKMPDKDTYGVDTGFTNGMAAGRDLKLKRMWLLHCYGAVGVGRDTAPESGDGTELYAVIGHAPRHLDRNVTVVGRILQGAEFLSSLPRGHGALGFYDVEGKSAKKEKPVAIKAIRLGSEVPEKERVNLEVLRTDTKLFDQLIQAKRNRAEEWFHFQAGHIDACNFMIPVRERTVAK